MDFTSNGMVQADSYYNKDVTTAVEAYNEGFSHFISEVDKGEPMFIALSIAPIFPYQYGTHAVSLATLGARSDSRNTA